MDPKPNTPAAEFVAAFPAIREAIVAGLHNAGLRHVHVEEPKVWADYACTVGLTVAPSKGYANLGEGHRLVLDFGRDNLDGLFRTYFALVRDDGNQTPSIARAAHRSVAALGVNGERLALAAGVALLRLIGRTPMIDLDR